MEDENMNELDKLIEAVEAGDTRISSYLPAAHHTVLGQFYKAMDGSLDAALALHEALLPGWVCWNMQESVFGHECDLTNGDKDASGVSKESMARAWLLAILRAYRSVQA